MTYVLLHGFWGEPKDWAGVIQRLPLGMNVVAPDLYMDDQLNPKFAWKEWANQFWHWCWRELNEEKVGLIGYSMGARLALNAIAHRPQSAHRALMISGRPWIEPNTIDQRLKWELEQAEKFRHAPWTELESQWNAQDVFKASLPVERRNDQELREPLAQSLLNWSPRHSDLTPEKLKKLDVPMDWLYGALDQNYLGTAKTLQELGLAGQIELLPGVGHRVLAAGPEFIVNWLERGEK